MGGFWSPRSAATPSSLAASAHRATRPESPPIARTPRRDDRRSNHPVMSEEPTTLDLVGRMRRLLAFLGDGGDAVMPFYAPQAEQQHTLVGLWVGGRIERITSY